MQRPVWAHINIGLNREPSHERTHAFYILFKCGYIRCGVQSLQQPHPPRNIFDVIFLFFFLYIFFCVRNRIKYQLADDRYDACWRRQSHRAHRHTHTRQLASSHTSVTWPRPLLDDLFGWRPHRCKWMICAPGGRRWCEWVAGASETPTKYITVWPRWKAEDENDRSRKKRQRAKRKKEVTKASTASTAGRQTQPGKPTQQQNSRNVKTLPEESRNEPHDGWPNRPRSRWKNSRLRDCDDWNVVLMLFFF